MATPTTPYAPLRTDWEVDGTFQIDAKFEPLGATKKRVTYSIQRGQSLIIGFVKIIQGLPLRLYSTPFSADSMLPPGVDSLEIQLTIPVDQRDLEWWLFLA